MERDNTQQFLQVKVMQIGETLSVSQISNPDTVAKEVKEYRPNTQRTSKAIMPPVSA